MESSIEEEIERNEEIQTIIDRIPNSITSIIIVLIASILIISIAILSFVKYPDVVTGDIIINNDNPPVKLVSNNAGKLISIAYKEKEFVKEGAFLATIENSASLADVELLIKLLYEFDLQKSLSGVDLSIYPNNLLLGELNTKYYSFITAISAINNLVYPNLFDKKQELLSSLLQEQQSLLQTLKLRISILDGSMRLMNKALERDSILFVSRHLSPADFKKTQLSNASFKDNYQNLIQELTTVRKNVDETNNNIQQNNIQKEEKQQQVQLSMITSYTELKAAIELWEQKYVIKSPIKGRVQYAKFWKNNQFVQAGEPVFTIIPNDHQIMGQMLLPAVGAGKVKVGQQVIVKLNNYPYLEYGNLIGKIKAISLTTNLLRTSDQEIDVYSVSVELPNQLKTNYGHQLEFQFENRGTAEIITQEKKLIERLFETIKYQLKK